MVVQALVRPRAAGVMFTRHPAAGDPRRLLITANYGLGEVSRICSKTASSACAAACRRRSCGRLSWARSVICTSSKSNIFSSVIKYLLIKHYTSHYLRLHCTIHNVDELDSKRDIRTRLSFAKYLNSLRTSKHHKFCCCINVVRRTIFGKL